MIKITFFFLFLLVRIPIHHQYEYGECTQDKQDTSKVVCSSDNGGNALPNDILLNITTLEVNSKLAGRQWLLTTPDTFTRFSNLTDLLIIGHLELSQNLIDMMQNLTMDFFNIETLTHLYIDDCAFWNGDRIIEIKWRAPPNLVHVVLINFRIVDFDWENVSTLMYLRVERTDFESLSEVANPSAVSLKELHTRDMVTVFKTYDIAFLCSLTAFSFEASLLSNEEQYCECERYKMWQEFLLIEENVNFTYTNEPLTCSSEKQNCSGYTLDEAKQNRTKCLTLVQEKLKSTTDVEFSFLPWLLKLPYYIWAIAFAVLVILCFFAFLMYMQILSTASDFSDEDEDEDSSED